jgi:aminopeptidase N
LTPDLVAFTFQGVANIDFTVDNKSANNTNNTKEIQLHAKELCFASASYTSNDGVVHHAEEIHVNTKTTIVTFIFATPVTDDSVTLQIAYSGFLNNQMAGFYRSSYTDIDGTSQIMASTQFEALDARRCFPCVDEPAAKATFTVALTIPRNRQCFSNMPSSSVVTVTATHKKVCFLESPRMSTYLLAFCVGEFDSVQAVSEHGVVVQVYTPPGKSAHGQFALDTAVKSLDAYDEFFQHHYPLPKLDMVAIPEFAAGAMENWGLVTYREVDLLIDPVKASSQQKQRVATVVTHELAHQWFGNLVTMKWWDDLWYVLRSVSLLYKMNTCWNLTACLGFRKNSWTNPTTCV